MNATAYPTGTTANGVTFTVQSSNKNRQLSLYDK